MRINKRIYELIEEGFIKESLIHESYDKDTFRKVYEFIGDKILSWKVTKIVYMSIKYAAEAGSMHDIVSEIVSNKNLANICRELELEPYIKYKDMRSSNNLLSGVLESVLGELWDYGKEEDVDAIVSFIMYRKFYS